MPAVIDTGGPRVLHCVEPVESPPIAHQRRAPSVLSPSRFTGCEPVRREDRRRGARVVVDAASHGALFGPSVDGTIPGSDERDDEFFIGERSADGAERREPCAAVSTTSSNDLGRLVSVAERRLAFRERYDACRKRQIGRRRRRLDREIVPRDETTPASLGGEERLSGEKREPDESPSTSGRHLTPETSRYAPEEGTDSSGLVARLFAGCDLERERRDAIYRGDEASSAAISSQRVLNCTCYEWRCQCGCKTISGSEGDWSPRERPRRRDRGPREPSKGRSYLQLALLLFLAAFGNTSNFKFNHAAFFGGKGTGLGAGLGAITFGTIFGTVTAVPVDLDAGVRAERSANLSHISGASRKIQMYIKNRHLQILRDGTVNGSNDDTSEYTIFQRTSVSRGQLRIQGVATCLYLCMDSCGLLYGSREYTEDCVFNETLEQHNYNTYSSVRWSTPKKSLYLGLNRRGQPRRVQAKGHNLGRLSAYARVLTQVAPADRVEALQAKMLGAEHSIRHHHNSQHHHHKEGGKHQPQTICPKLPAQEKDGRDRFRCRKRKKRKKWKRHCKEGEKPGPHCGIVESHGRATNVTSGGGQAMKSQQSESAASRQQQQQSKRSCEGEASEELCRKQALDAPAKKRKSRIEATKSFGGAEPESRRKKEMRTGGRTTSKQQPEERAPNSDPGEDVSEPESPRRRVNGPNGNAKSRKKTPAGARRRATSGRPARTTIPSSRVVDVTPASSWYPGASSTPPPPPSSSEPSPWEARTKSAIYSAKNSVTSAETAKDRSSEEPDQTFREDRALLRDEAIIGLLPPENFETSTENLPSSSLAAGDWSSSETSDEAKSDESSIQQQEDETSLAIGEFTTRMTTMDTTSPERTEVYSRATTQSIARLLVQDSTTAVADPTKSHQPDYERLAM